MLLQANVPFRVWYKYQAMNRHLLWFVLASLVPLLLLTPSVMRFTTALLSCLAASVSLSQAKKPKASNEPAAPALNFLYTLYAVCGNPIYRTEGPRGIRTAIPIVGGNFTGPRLNGKVLDLGADWGVTDPQTGIFSADTRYNLQTNDGANIFLQTSGPQQPDGKLHLRVQFETGDKRYYWLNNVLGEC